MKKIWMLLWLIIEMGYSDPKGVYDDDCAECHGMDGKTSAMGKSVAIANLTLSEIKDRLQRYKLGTRNKYGLGNLMKNQLADYDDEYIEELAYCISSLSSNRIQIIESNGVKLEILSPKNVKRTALVI